MQKINVLSEKQDKELVELLKDGSREALGELYARYRERLMHLCKQNLKNDADAEDIVNDIFLKLWETRHTINSELSFSGYLHTMTENYIKNILRHLDVHLRFAKNIYMNAIDSTNETEDSIIDNDYTDLLNELIESLPSGQKEIFRLNRIEKYTYQEISELMQMPVENVRKQVSRASKNLKDRLSNYTDINFQTVITILIFFS